jgi:hemolysin D
MTPPRKSIAAPAKGRAKRDPIFGDRPRWETEFLPAALEIVETPAPPLPRIAVLVLTALLATALAWACLGQVDIIATAPGRIVPSGGSKVIQPLEAGIVTDIRVHDGAHVHTGDVLVELEPTETSANQARAKGELAAAQLDVARLRTVALGAPFVAPAGADPVAVRIASRQASEEVGELRDKLDKLSDDILQHRAALDEAHGEVDRLQAVLPLERQRAAVFQSLSTNGYGSRLQLLEAEEKQADTERSLEVQKRRIPELEAQIESADRSRAEARDEAAKTALAALAEAQLKASSLSDELAKAAERLKARTLVAPVDGTVQELSIHTIGGVVEPGQTLMRVAPDAGLLEVEARLLNRDIGFVREGMQADIKVQTFPFTRYGVLRATVLSVSHDAAADTKDPSRPTAPTGGDQPEQGEAQYLMRLRLDRSTMVIDGQTVQLTPGMAVTAEIKTGRRRVIDYILSPLEKVTKETGHER